MAGGERDRHHSHEESKLQREFIDAQAVQHPVSLAELAEATDFAFSEVEGTFKPSIPQQSNALESWIAASDALESAFLEAADGALGARVIELLRLNDETFAERYQEAQLLIQQSSRIAHAMYPLVHRLQILGFAPNREEVVEKLSSGEISKQIKIHGVSVTPRRLTMIGALRVLDRRVGTNVWAFEYAPELPTTAVVSDPFDQSDRDIVRHWSAAMQADYHAERKHTPTVYSVSEGRTARVVADLEQVAEHNPDNELRNAATHVADWLNRKAFYYQNPKPGDFELYHLGMEAPDDLMRVLQSLDTVKHKDPEFFYELLGMNPENPRERGQYFGSFLHKALFNTQRAIDRSTPQLGEMAIASMLRQLMTLDEHVRGYAGTVSQESLKAMAHQMKEQIEGEKTVNDKVGTLVAMVIPYVPIAVDAEVRRQLEALRETSAEHIATKLKERVDDIEHPLRLMEYIAGMPNAAFSDPEVEKLISQCLKACLYTPDKRVAYINLREACRTRRVDVVGELYRRIPLVDETRNDLGWGRRVAVVARDAYTAQGFFSRSADKIAPTQFTDKSRKDANNILSVLKTGTFGSDLQTIIPTLPRLQRDIIAQVEEQLRVGDHWKPPAQNEADRSYRFGQWIIERQRHDPSFALSDSDFRKISPSTAFLSILAHPEGAEVAFKYFQDFAERIPAERMAEILNNLAVRICDFVQLLRHPRSLSYLDAHLAHLENKIWGERGIKATTIEDLKKLHRIILNRRTEWTVTDMNGFYVDIVNTAIRNKIIAVDELPDYYSAEQIQVLEMLISQGYGFHNKPHVTRTANRALVLSVSRNNEDGHTEWKEIIFKTKSS